MRIGAGLVAAMALASGCASTGDQLEATIQGPRARARIPWGEVGEFALGAVVVAGEAGMIGCARGDFGCGREAREATAIGAVPIPAALGAGLGVLLVYLVKGVRTPD